MADDSNLGGTGLDPMLEVLIAALIDNGTLDAHDLANMGRRLDEGGNPDLSAALLGLLLSCEIDTPDNRRSVMHIVDGGNDTD